MLSREIDRVRVELASVEIERASAISSLTQEKTARSEGEREIRSLSADNDSLRVQVARQEECIAALRERQVELSHIATLQTENYNRFVSDSVWGKAFAANQKAMSTAIDDYYNAYSRAFNGALSAANTWIDRGNTQVDKANKQLSVMNSEIEAGNQANQDIEGALSDVVTAILEAATTCGFSEVETPA
jgi:chromosome segregation ATPase